MSIRTNKSVDMTVPGPCQISFDYEIDLAGIKLDGSIKKLVHHITSKEQLTEKVIQEEIQESIKQILDKAHQENPEIAKLDGEIKMQIDIDNVKTGFWGVNLNISR